MLLPEKELMREFRKDLNKWKERSTNKLSVKKQGYSYVSTGRNLQESFLVIESIQYVCNFHHYIERQWYFYSKCNIYFFFVYKHWFIRKGGFWKLLKMNTYLLVILRSFAKEGVQFISIGDIIFGSFFHIPIHWFKWQ